MDLVGAKPGKATGSGLEKQPGLVNYFIGDDPKQWRTRIPTYAKAKFAGVYPGVDVVYYGREPRAKSQEPGAGKARSLSALEYDFILHPGADPSRIRLAFEGAEKVRVAGGDLILTTPAGEVRMKRPYAYQTINGRRVQVACDYRLHSPLASRLLPAVAFKLARYDASLPLVVDPVLAFSTYLGGTDDDGSKGIAVGGDGAVYVTGHTYGSDFPTSAGAYDPSANGELDAFVMKLDSTGSNMLYGTYIGGSGWDHCNAIAVGSSGGARIAGETVSADFPTTPGAFQTALNGSEGDAFVLALSPDGSALSGSTYIGGAGWDCAYAVAVDGSGHSCLSGYTESADWPTSAGAFDRTYFGSGSDAFAAKITSDGSAVLCSTYLGADGNDYAFGIAVTPAGAMIVAGLTSGGAFPVTSGVFQAAYGGGPADGFVLKLAPDASSLEFSTFLGGSGSDEPYGVALDGSGNVYVAGKTTSTNFPTTAGAFGTALSGPSDGFVAQLSPAGSGLIYGTYVGGSADDMAAALAVDSAGNAFATGYTLSTDFPITADAFDTTLTVGDLDAFVVVVAPDGGSLLLGSFAGGSETDTGLGIAFGPDGGICVTGNTWSADFGATAGSFDSTYNGNGEGFAIKVFLPARAVTTLYTIDRSGTITETVGLRSYDLMRVSDHVLLVGKAVTFRIDGTAVGSALTNTGGDALLLWTVANGPPTRTITAEFAGDAVNLPCSATATLTAQTHATKMYGLDRSGRITAYTILKAFLYRLDSTPVRDRTIAFKLDGTPLASDATTSAGRAQIGYTIADGAGAGGRTIRAEWAGDGGYLASYCVNTLTVLPSQPYIWVLPKSVPFGGTLNAYAYFRRLNDYAKQTGKPVTFKLDGTPLQTVLTDASAIARHAYPTVEPRGAHVLRCEWAGDAWVEAGYGEGAITIY
jgi:hypothetical protein